MSRLRLSGLMVAAIAAASVAVRAAGPTFWVTSTQADLLKGESDGVSVDELGRILAGPALATTADLAAPQVWCLRVAPDGTWYTGTGGDGRVVRGRPGAAPDTLLDTQENSVYAVAVAPDGRVYAASSPDGKVYVVNPDGTSRTFFDPAEKYIWALAVDATGHLWVGTGTPATLYRVDPDGTSHLVYKPPADHVVALAFDADGHVIAGTESPGRLYRIDANDHPFALLESDMTEVGAIHVASDGTIYAAAVDGSVETGGDAASALAAAASAPGATSSSGSSSSAPPAVTPKSTIFRVTADGVSSAFWQTDAEIYDLAAGDNGAILAATGPDGRVYRIRPDGSSVLVNAADAKQMTRIVRSATGTCSPAPTRAASGRWAPRRRRPPPISRPCTTRRTWRTGASCAGSAPAAYRCSRDPATPTSPMTPGAGGRGPTRLSRAPPLRVRPRATCNGRPCFPAACRRRPRSPPSRSRTCPRTPAPTSRK